MSQITLLLDLDGVLITSPPWRKDEQDTDGYSKFKQNCVQNLNTLLLKVDFRILLTSSRRKGKTLHEFNEIFARRKIGKPISGFLPVYEDCKNRKEEILQFLKENVVNNFLIIDDDKSLSDLDSEIKNRLVQTEFLLGFNDEKLTEAVRIVESFIM